MRALGAASWHDWLADVEPDRFERLIRVTLPVSFLSTVGAAILAWQFVAGPSSAVAMIWLAAFVAVNLARVVAGLVYVRVARRGSATRAWVAWALGSTVLHAALWGLASVAMWSPGSPQAESLLHIILAAVAMGAAAHLSGFYPVLAAFVVLVLAPLSLRDLSIGGGYHLVLAASSALIGLYTLLNGRNQSRMITEVFAERRKNAELVDALHIENRRTEAARRAAEQAHAARARFFAAANHDLRQPLHAMGLLAQTLHTRCGGVNVQEVSAHMVACVDGMTEVVDELLDISRLDAGNVALQRSTFALDDLVRELVRTHLPLAQSKGLPIRIDAVRAIVHSDRTLLARVVSNLLSNAIRYTERGAVRVLLQARNSDVELAVEDTGIGIAQEELPRIFDEFYQVGNPARDRRLGLGLGLATVKRLCDRLGLDVSVQSKPGSGSRFSLRLPQYVSDEDQVVDVPDERAAADPLARRRVLVIEDDADSRTAMLGLLHAWGCEVQGAADGPAALAHVVRGFRPDAVLADLRLPGGAGGVAAVEALRAALAKDLPALVVTGDVGSEQACLARAQGYAVLAKPVKAMALRAFLCEALAPA